MAELRKPDDGALEDAVEVADSEAGLPSVLLELTPVLNAGKEEDGPVLRGTEMVAELDGPSLIVTVTVE